MQLCAAVLGEDFVLGGFSANVVNSGCAAAPLHVDFPYLEYGYTVDAPMPPEELEVQVIVALDHFTASNGGTRIWPRSQRRRENPYAYADQSEAQALFDANCIAPEVPAGSCLIALGLLWHQTGANTTEQDRVGLLGQYVANHVSASRTALPADVLERCPCPHRLKHFAPK